MRRVLFFLNPLLMEHRNRRAVVDRVAGMLRETGSTVELQDTLSAHSAGEQAQEAVASGFDTIFVCGGDGTVFQVIQGVAGSSTSLGVIPFGTGNVLAQNLRLPRDPIAAMRVQMNARAVSIPLGKITCKTAGHTKDRNWYFTIAAGMGVHAALMNLAPTGQGKRHGGRLAYFIGGARLLIDHPIQSFQLELTQPDGVTQTVEACEAIATHVNEINAWRPAGDPFASWLRVAWVPPTGRLGLGHASFHALVTGKTNGHRGWGSLPFPQYGSVTRMICRPLSSTAYRTPLLVEADGEVLGASYTVIGVSRKKLRLLWPTDAKTL